MLARSSILLALLIGAAGCGGSSGDPCETMPDSCTGKSTLVSMDFAAKDSFYAAAFPTDARLLPSGGVDVSGFPNPGSNDLVTRLLAMVSADARGFGVSSGIYFSLSGPIAESELPALAASVTDASPVFLAGVDPSSPDHGVRYPIDVRFLADGGPYGAANMLALLPLQGAPLRSGTRYAAVVKRSLHDAAGKQLGLPAAMAALAKGSAPDGLADRALSSYKAALTDLGLDAMEVAGMTVFTTGTPEAAIQKVTTAMIASPPSPEAPFMPDEVFGDFCVYSTTIKMPEYQQGTVPYTDAGGDWAFDAAGNPVLQRMEEGRFTVTIPRAPMPASGYPVVVMSQTGAGGLRALVDRGPQAMDGGPPITPGTGPALQYAKAGFAGASIEGPLEGLRNPTTANEDYLIFNVGNPAAMRDNVRQSAAELALTAHILETVTIDVSACPGATAPGNTARFDTGMMAIMGHSMGATISPLALASEPRFKAGMFSGLGGSWIDNVIYKQKPIPVKGIAEVLVGYAGHGYELSPHDPVLSILQWACDGADPPSYARRLITETAGPPRHVLMMQGIVDHYIMPPIADAASLSFGLDLAGDELDDTADEIKDLAPLGPLLGLRGRGKITLPASLNVTGAQGVKVTAVVTQNQSDGIEDGHEAVFQTEGPKHQYRCFLEGLLKGAPRVPSPGKADDPCD